MRINNAQTDLRQLFESAGPQQFNDVLIQCIEDGDLKPNDFSLRELFEATGGDPTLLQPGRSGGLMLAQESAVTNSTFANITGQIVYTRLMERFREADRGLFERLFTTVDTRLDGEKIGGVTRILDEEFETGEGESLRYSGFNEDYLETPSTTKYALGVAVTKEAIFFDRTSQVLRRASSVGERLSTGRLKRGLKVVIGATNNHSWRGTSYNTFLTSGAWINKKTGHAITDWSDIDEIELLWSDMTEPDTGNPLDEPITRQVLCTQHKRATLRRIIRATEIRQGDGSAGNADTHSSNPLEDYEIISSALFYSLLQSELSLSAANAKNITIWGDFREAFWYMQNWPITVVPAPSNDEPSFEKDIVQRYKASERGVPFAAQPRRVIYNQEH